MHYEKEYNVVIKIYNSHQLVRFASYLAINKTNFQLMTKHSLSRISPEHDLFVINENTKVGILVFRMAALLKLEITVCFLWLIQGH